MSKSRHVSRPKTRWNLIIILLVACVLSYAGFKYVSSSLAQPINIMAITPIELTYGNTTISGILQKDSPVGQPGTYLLILPDMRTVLLYNVLGIDSLLGLSVSASGLLSPPPSDIAPMSMTVKSITVAQ